MTRRVRVRLAAAVLVAGASLAAPVTTVRACPCGQLAAADDDSVVAA